MAWPTRTFPTDEFLRRWYQDYANTLMAVQQHISEIYARLQAAEQSNAQLTAQVEQLTAQVREITHDRDRLQRTVEHLRNQLREPSVQFLRVNTPVRDSGPGFGAFTSSGFSAFRSRGSESGGFSNLEPPVFHNNHVVSGFGIGRHSSRDQNDNFAQSSSSSSSSDSD